MLAIAACHSLRYVRDPSSVIRASYPDPPTGRLRPGQQSRPRPATGSEMARIREATGR
jgi:hypothetical protein